MSHVGKCFDLSLGGHPLRIVVVGQEPGWPKEPLAPGRGRLVPPEARYRTVMATGYERRYYKEGEHAGRNPHMRGTTSALRVILGLGTGSSFEDEFVKPSNGQPFHVFDGFALVNRLLCSAGTPKTSQGKPTTTMMDNCLEHFTATMRILEPTLVITQGAKVAAHTREVFLRERSFSDHLHETRFDGSKVLVCNFSHPSAHGPIRWGDRLDAPYLSDVVVPTLEMARQML